MPKHILRTKSKRPSWQIGHQRRGRCCTSLIFHSFSTLSLLDLTREGSIDNRMVSQFTAGWAFVVVITDGHINYFDTQYGSFSNWIGLLWVLRNIWYRSRETNSKKGEVDHFNVEKSPMKWVPFPRRLSCFPCSRLYNQFPPPSFSSSLELLPRECMEYVYYMWTSCGNSSWVLEEGKKEIGMCLGLLHSKMHLKALSSPFIRGECGCRCPI